MRLWHELAVGHPERHNGGRRCGRSWHLQCGWQNHGGSGYGEIGHSPSARVYWNERAWFTR